MNNLQRQVVKLTDDIDDMIYDINDLTKLDHTIKNHDISNQLIEFRIYLESLLND